MTTERSLLTAAIFEGTLLSDGKRWSANKQGVTDAAVWTVAQHLVHKQESLEFEMDGKKYRMEAKELNPELMSDKLLRGTLLKYTEWLLKKGYINHPTAIIDYEIAEQYLDSNASLCVRQANGAGKSTLPHSVSGWLLIEGNEELYNAANQSTMLVKFDNGEIRGFSQTWPLAKATHFKL